MAKKVLKGFGNCSVSSEWRLTADISQRVSVFWKNESDCSLAGSQCFSLLIYCRYWLQVGSFSQKPLLFVGLISK